MVTRWPLLESRGPVLTRRPLPVTGQLLHWCTSLHLQTDFLDALFRLATDQNEGRILGLHDYMTDLKRTDSDESTNVADSTDVGCELERTDGIGCTGTDGIGCTGTEGIGRTWRNWTPDTGTIVTDGIRRTWRNWTPGTGMATIRCILDYFSTDCFPRMKWKLLSLLALQVIMLTSWRKSFKI